MLTASETDEASDAVLEYLRGEEVSMAEWLDDPLTCLAERSWSEETIRQKYLQGLTETAYSRTRTSTAADGRTREAQLLRAVELLETVEAIAQESLGPTGQHGAPIPTLVDATRLVRDAGNPGGLDSGNPPEQGTVIQCAEPRVPFVARSAGGATDVLAPHDAEARHMIVPKTRPAVVSSDSP